MLPTTMRQLYELQELDLDIDRQKADLASVQARLRDESALAIAKAEAAKWEDSVRQLKKQQAAQELEIRQLQAKKQDLDRRLYGGSIRNPKEMESTQAELLHATKRIQEEEDHILNVMVALEESERGLARATEELEQAQKLRAETLTSLSREEGALSSRLTDLGTVRQKKVAEIPSAILATYERTRKAVNGLAVAKVERRMCSGCRLTLPTTDLQRVRAAQEPIFCSSCGRILYMG